MSIAGDRLLSEVETIKLERIIVAVWSVVNLMVVMNTTMFNLALPSILTEFALDSARAAWLVSGYSVMFAMSTLTFSRLSDFVPLSRLALSGLTILGIACIVGFIANNFYVLLAARVLQASGAGSISGLGMVLAGRFVPLQRRGKAIAMISSSASLAFGLGPLLGGIITSALGWRYLFLLTGLATLFIPVLLKLLPKESFRKGSIDYKGAILIGLVSAGIIIFLNSFSIILLVVTAIIFLILWIYFKRFHDPFISPQLLQNKLYMKMVTVASASIAINFSNLFVMPILLATVFNKSAFEVGLFIFPGAMITFFAGRWIGKWIDSKSAKPVLFFGHFILIFSLITFGFTATINPVFTVVLYIFTSTGLAALFTSNSHEISRILPPEQISSGMGVQQLMQFLSGAVSVTITGLLLTYQENFSPFVTYRTIYLFLVVVILSSLVNLVIYYRQLKAANISEA